MQNSTFILEKRSIYPLLLQRSILRSTPLKKFRQIFNKLGYIAAYDKLIDRTIVKQIEQLRYKTISKNYYLQMHSILRDIEPHLPNICDRYLEIGPGLAGFSSLIYSKYKGNCDLYLLDKNGLAENNVIGFNPQAEQFSYYCIFNHVQNFLQLNGVKKNKIRMYDVDKDGFPCAKFDLVVSLLAWGYHFPVSTYINNVVNYLSANGVLIIDIRVGTDGLQELNHYFLEVEVITSESNFIRVKCIKPRSTSS